MSTSVTTLILYIEVPYPKRMTNRRRMFLPRTVDHSRVSHKRPTHLQRQLDYRTPTSSREASTYPGTVSTLRIQSPRSRPPPRLRITDHNLGRRDLYGRNATTAAVTPEHLLLCEEERWGGVGDDRYSYEGVVGDGPSVDVQ